MYKKVTQTRLPKYVILTIAPLLGVMTSCDQKSDPSYEKQSLVLAAEKATFEVNLKLAEDKLKTAEATIANLTGEIATLKKNPPKEVAAVPKFDKETIQLGFMRGVDELKTKIEKENTQHTVESVTFEKMNIPTDKPFSSGVTIQLKSKKTNQYTSFRWQGHGSLKGEWDFEPKGQVISGSGGQVADNNTGTKNTGGNTGTNTGGNTGTNTGGNTRIKVTRQDPNDKGSHRVIWPEDAPRTTGQPTKARPGTPQPQVPKAPVQPNKPAKPKQPTDPNSHKVDWDKLKK